MENIHRQRSQIRRQIRLPLYKNKLDVNLRFVTHNNLFYDSIDYLVLIIYRASIHMKVS
jgi:hypothetical protein